MVQSGVDQGITLDHEFARTQKLATRQALLEVAERMFGENDIGAPASAGVAALS